MRTGEEPRRDVRTHGQRLGDHQRPGHPIARDVGAELAPHPRQLHPDIGERERAAADGAVKVVLDLDTSGGRDGDQDVRVARGRRLLEDDARLGVRTGVGLRGDARDQRRVAVARHGLVDVIELVAGPPDVGPRAVDGEHAAVIARRPDQSRSANIGIGPRGRDRIVRRDRDVHIVEGNTAVLPDVMRGHEQPDGRAPGHGDARRANLCPRVPVGGFPRREGIANPLQLEPFVGRVVAGEIRAVFEPVKLYCMRTPLPKVGLTGGRGLPQPSGVHPSPLILGVLGLTSGVTSAST